MGGETWYGYNDWHEPTLVGTPEGKVVGREYDGRGNLVRLTHADGGEETWEYDEDNRTTAHTGTDGLREEWAFDAQGRLATYKGPDGAIATYEYTGDGGRPSVVEYGDGRLELCYGVLGLPASVTDERGRCERFTFDAYGRQTAQAHADGTRTEWRRDRMGRVVRYAAPGRRTLSIDYDAYDNPVEVRSGNASVDDGVHTHGQSAAAGTPYRGHAHRFRPGVWLRCLRPPCLGGERAGRTLHV